MALHEAAQSICAQNYSFKDRSSCERCPISRECRSECGAGQQALDAWRARVETLAVQVLGQSSLALAPLQTA